MGSYQIIQLEQLSGIKAHTLRIWEKRYKILKPHRTSTNIRFYDDDHVRKLLNIATLLTKGYKISFLASLTEKEVYELIQKFDQEKNVDHITDKLINDLISAMLDFNETIFEKIFLSAIKRMGLFETMTKVVYPFLHKTGLMWSINETIPIQEHFASSIILRKLMNAIDQLPFPTKKNKKIILFLPPDELHEIGLLFSNYLLRANGYQTIYLGPHVPYENIQQAIKHTHPSHLLTFFISRKNEEKIKKELKKILQVNKKIKILVNGYPEIVDSISSLKNIIPISYPAELLKNI